MEKKFPSNLPCRRSTTLNHHKLSWGESWGRARPSWKTTPKLRLSSYMLGPLQNNISPLSEMFYVMGEYSDLSNRGRGGEHSCVHYTQFLVQVGYIYLDPRWAGSATCLLIWADMTRRQTSRIVSNKTLSWMSDPVVACLYTPHYTAVSTTTCHSARFKDHQTRQDEIQHTTI
jgi:hypothetical protein